MRDPDDRPDFREWADDPANAAALDMLVARFVADDGAEMVVDLIGCFGQQHQATAERWMGRLRERFERWWADGRPRLPATNVRVTDWTPAREREAQALLAANLPPGAAFGLTRRWRKLPGGASEADGYACDVRDGRASAAGRGDTPLAAAKAALDAWREFVTGTRVELADASAPEAGIEGGSEAEAPTAARPPLLDAPSADRADDASSSGRRAV